MKKKLEACIKMPAKQVAEEAEKRYKALTDIIYPLAQNTLEETPLHEMLISNLTLYMLREHMSGIGEEWWDFMKTVFGDLYEPEENAPAG